jgi:uncharacterized membrane protein
MLILTEKIAFHRVGALIDGVFAIVMTILVLDIKVPHDIDIFRQFNIDQFLTGQFQDIAIYMISFIVLAYLWIINHSESHFIKFTDYVHIWITVLYLMFIALVPFSAALVNKFPGDEVSELFLSGNVFIIGVLNYLSWSYLARHKALLEGALSENQIAKEKKKIMLMPIVSMLAMASAFIYPHASAYILLLAPVVMLVMELRWAVKH